MQNYSKVATFTTALVRRLIAATQDYYTDNSQGFYQFGDRSAQLEDLMQLKEIPTITIEQILDEFSELFSQEISTKTLLYSMLKEPQSKHLLVDIAAYAVLGHLRVKLPYYTEENIRLRSALVAKGERASEAAPDIIKSIREKWPTDFFSLFEYQHNNRNFKVYTISEEFFRHCYAPSYTVSGEHVNVSVNEGDVVLDCGAAFGDVSLQFADRVGENGHVYCFEPYHRFLRVYHENMRMNAELASRVSLIEKGVWHISGETLSFIEGGGGSRIDESNQSSFKITTATIDETVASLDLSQVDFIKMDIEGAELNALRGAIKTLKKFRPKLAICLYHSPEDFHTIPYFLKSLDLGYEFSLNHHYINAWETVLYAKTRD
ncbi:FkbM family methyltransferase [Maridesulfovibrio hydrothermalis]|uniref:Methyltransferase FkbM family n=1 Tax=Maridesulfovibrio hydrothermalis AM13 = DSM 14728 TaxID=1121451 RepID=L0R769_9BACT|nr:FkbM family methyltransferase [Maridesulfovibrio hydrothermalis]CCO22584.1 Methyltransferase FkbM family [Maridesulfovibrio hydrothermalis AM13 = DSM 14728]